MSNSYKKEEIETAINLLIENGYVVKSNSYKKEEIETAINLLIENGYVVKKLTVGQLQDAKECEDCGFEGECAFCRCSICIIQ